MRHQLQLNDTGPLNVLVAAFMGGYGLPLEQLGHFDPGDHEIPELLGFAVEGAHMPAQAIVDQGKGYDLALSTAAGDEWYSMLSGCSW